MPTALVIDDDSTSTNVIARVLEEKGFSVLATLDAEQAAWACENFKVDVIVADILLRSPYSGTDIARGLRRSCPEVPVLFVSGTPLEGWSHHDFANIEALLPGRIEFLMKPFKAETIVAAVSQLMNSAYSETGIRAALDSAKNFRKFARVLRIDAPI